jgi:hypothetical protein
MVKQFLIAVDQLINTLIDGGYADETISARAYRMTDASIGWHDLHVSIDWFFRVFLNDYNHCYNSYISEVKRKQLPKEYQTVRIYADFF